MVAPLDIDKVAALPSHDPDALDLFLEMSEYLHNMMLYAHVPPPGPLKQTGFTREEERLMEGHKFERFDDEPKGSTRGFKVGQFFKESSRPVWNCYIKKHFKSSPPHYHLTKPRTMAHHFFQIAGPDTIVVQFDFSAYYDQFALRNGVSAMFCFRDRFNRVCALTRLPMGFNVACAIAQSTTWQLLNFERHSQIFTCIDNVAFAGTPAQVLHDVSLFLSRCQQVEATLNEISSAQISDFLASPPEGQLQQVCSWHRNEFTFLGIEYNWLARTRKMAKKTADKISAAHTCLTAMSDTILPKQLATVIGLLRYADQILHRPAYAWYTTLRWARSVASYLQQEPARWDNEILKLPGICRAELLAWFEQVVPNAAVPIALPLPPAPPMTLITDASADGWGALHLQDDHLEPYAGTWLHQIHHSASAEPAAVFEAAAKVLSPDSEGQVLVLTDHLPLVYASRSAAPRGYAYNNLLLRLQRAFPRVGFVFSFLPGRLNLADALSRGGDGVPEDGLSRASEYAGTGWADALSYHVFGGKCSRCDGAVPWQC